MAYQKFSGTELETVANWTLNDNTAGAGFENAGTLFIEKGGQDINPSGVSLTCLVSDSIAVFSVYNFSGNLGSEAGAVQFPCGEAATLTGLDPTPRIDYFADRGGFWYTASGGGGGTSTAATCRLLRIGGGGHFRGMGGDFHKIDIQGATAEFNSVCTFTATAFIDNKGGNLTVNSHASDVLPTMNSFAGSTKLYRATTTLNIYGGTVTLDAPTGVVTTINLLGPNARLILKSTLANGAASPIVTLNCKAGVLDLSQLKRKTQATNAVVTSALTIIDNPLFVWPTTTGITIEGRPQGNARF